MSKNCKVTFYAEDMGNPKKQFTCIMRSDATLEKFVDNFQNFGGFRRFDYDYLEDSCNEKLPIIPATIKGFGLIISVLYSKEVR